ncbi:DUF3509 domain-containing protein [Pseudomonas gingeri]|uniref:DUF3509 domain-containing protein n=1 Tax=Pseudomonas gingeri TaxID=117681 RepID=A0A7Y8C3Q0_9PSED|nr:DUF3509 domain-containing protein [Pseudomonas gingeri]NWA23455.1 DUF3509 domain-containing protein [Pseudomonas gingeri]NWB98820.1 DUF3509 domain-containing protein [Pseudomonas gingeri]NWD68445.1 DUF3509 domain-containing protein [Pseudomonas gingeri]NWD74583.1 DUF3509 domain-containing protein [Pseudomonas gingeri]
MDNPFQLINEAFQPEYRVNLSLQGLDGDVMLTLSNADGVVAKRMISAEQRNDPRRLKRLIQSVQFGIAIEQGHSAMDILAAMTDSDSVKLATLPAPTWSGSGHRVGRPAIVTGRVLTLPIR